MLIRCGWGLCDDIEVFSMINGMLLSRNRE